MCGLPPGFQFLPSDEDLVVHFLRRKASLLPGQHDLVPSLGQLYDPWELHGRALRGGNHWYFFARRTENRVTPSGHWEEEEEEDAEWVSSGDEEVGVKKTFVFCVGEGAEGTKTSWVMHEYHLLESVGSCSTSSSGRTGRRSSRKNGHTRMESDTWVMCRVHDAREGCFDGDDDGDGTELSCLDEEAFLSMDDDLDEASWPN
ncbi:NAC domain-containing protein 104-like isoform X1 [Iris pallida]|uniref:NAC domain-containing protein 104-like isoform X1 n=1 Tax=Iris pallida TaxID=29817 RepID=A0AAX6E9Q7_IRIPA|nr:NAC domain-containing protein 104-like isoform X1 [Iris pallida]